MSASIFNQNLYHSFVVGDTGNDGDGLNGSLIELYGNPPDTWNVVPGTEGKFKPGTTLSIARINYDPSNMFYPAYFLTGLHKNGYAVITAIWTSQRWDVRGAE